MQLTDLRGKRLRRQFPIHRRNMDSQWEILEARAAQTDPT
jgi:hypothetical protein